jgi:hypothetical protein
MRGVVGQFLRWATRFLRQNPVFNTYYSTNAMDAWKRQELNLGKRGRVFMSEPDNQPI